MQMRHLKSTLWQPCSALPHAPSYSQCCLEVFATGQHLLLVWVKIESVLELRNIRALLVAEGWYWINNAIVAEIPQSHLVLALPNAIQIPAV